MECYLYIRIARFIMSNKNLSLSNGNILTCFSVISLREESIWIECELKDLNCAKNGSQKWGAFKYF